MEFSLCSIDCALPVEVTIDEDNGRYTIRKSDSSGEYFNTAQELIDWIKQNFSVDQFCYQEEYEDMMKQLNLYEILQ
ncbi:hypothetical protein [Bacillus massiliigorillae]|uniref:hypothetical protein n=1 Tax=Bacillus massiliigorillae TaxID=1243664 RepID=UPI0003A62844|nr:hypothetical protein [Bacillus massiliigorillae]